MLAREISDIEGQASKTGETLKRSQTTPRIHGSSGAPQKVFRFREAQCPLEKFPKSTHQNTILPHFCPFWPYFVPDFGHVLALFRPHFGTHFGPILAPFWLHFGPISAPFRTHFGHISDPFRTPFRTHFGPISDPFRTHFGPISDPFRTHFDPISDPFRTHFGPHFGHFGPILDPFGVHFLIFSDQKSNQNRPKSNPKPKKPTWKIQAKSIEVKIKARKETQKQTRRLQLAPLMPTLWVSLCSSHALLSLYATCSDSQWNHRIATFKCTRGTHRRSTAFAASATQSSCNLYSAVSVGVKRLGLTKFVTKLGLSLQCWQMSS